MAGRVASTSRTWGARRPTPIAAGICAELSASWFTTRPALRLCLGLRHRAAALDLGAGADRHINPRLRVAGGLRFAGAGVHAAGAAIVLARRVDAETAFELIGGLGRRRWRGLGQDRQYGYRRGGRSGDHAGFCQHVHGGSPKVASEQKRTDRIIPTAASPNTP